MPPYEYRCEACEGHFEQRQKMSETAIESCPACGGHVKRLISGGAGIISKDGGNYPAARAGGCPAGGPGCGQEMACGAACGCGH